MVTFKINNIDKISPYTFIQDDIISIITIENNSKDIVYVNLEKIKLTNQNKIQFNGDNIVLDMKKCTLENCTTAEGLAEIFLDYTGSNIYIPTNEDILKNNYHLCKCNFISPESIQVGPDTSNITQTYPNFDLTTTFTLHSKPGSSKFIYLNFIGGNVTNTLWNTDYNIATIVVRPFGNNIVLADDYKTKIQYIWRAVSEAYSIWDVDVTTEIPSTIQNTLLTSTSYGVQCYIGGSYSDWFQSSAGGVAFVFSFNLALPCFVFSENLGNDSKYIADAINHEIGHTLGLYHDGTSSADYYTGHSNWAPIMGVGYSSNVVQWSRGDYASANNKQDDIAIISTYLTPIVDDHMNNFTNASFIQNGDFIGGIINNQTDVDFFTFNSDVGEINLNVDVTLLLPTVKIGMVLYNSLYQSIATNTINNTMNANITHSVTSPGKYYLKIAGVGGNGVDLSGNPTTSFNDYGSIGRYKITGSWPEYNPISINNVIVTGINKVYDGNTNISVTITSSDITLGDDVLFNYTSASFNNKNVGNNKVVTLSGITITGNDANKYILNVPTTQLTTANITPKPLTIIGVTTTNKIYDGTLTANVNILNSQLSGVIIGDTLLLNKPNIVNSLFSNKTIGINKNIIMNNFSISGIDSLNYSLTQPLITATITPKILHITGTRGQYKIIYNGTLKPLFNIYYSKLMTPIIKYDKVILNKNKVSGLFKNKNVGKNKLITITGFTLTGNDSLNYKLIQPINITGAINPRELYITNTTAADKNYDANSSANVITTQSQLLNKISSDDITLIKTNVIGNFLNSIKENNKNVIISGFTIDGTDKNNYNLLQPTNVFANITN